MCGFILAIDKDHILKEDQLRSMADRIRHRGPDGFKIHYSGITKMVHVRLAIIDCSDEANQPMVSSCEKISLVFNGEIYNHRELRKELVAEGVKFVTSHSDTEVILQGYIKWGLKKLVNRLTGIFAFIINDRLSGNLYAVRDHFGIKPLYTLNFEGVIYFASELKALKEIPNFKFELDDEYMIEHLYFRHVKAPNTLIKNIKKLQPAEIQKINLHTLKIKHQTYWNPYFKIGKIIDPKERLKQAINYNLESDVGVALTQSGGFDSRSLASLIKFLNPRANIDTYTISYPNENSFDEASIAKRHAKSLNFNYHQVDISQKDFEKHLTEVVYFLEEPISAPVSLPVFLMAKSMSKDGIKVALSGEGADEVYCGYNSWKIFLKLARFQRFMPHLSRLILICAKSILSSSLFNNYRFEYLKDIVWRGVNSVNLFWGGSWDFCSNDISKLLTTKREDVLKKIELKKILPEWNCFKKSASHLDQIGWMTYFDLRSRLPELLLNRLDKQFMAHSIEARVPYLDHLSVQAYFSSPSNIREKEIKKGKDFIRNIVYKILKDSNVSLIKKKGFQAPVSKWASSSFGNHARRLVINFSKVTGIFEENAVQEIFDRGTRHYFSLLFFVIWYCNYIENVLPEFDLIFEHKKTN